MRRIFFLPILFTFLSCICLRAETKQTLVFRIELKRDIDVVAMRIIHKGMEEARVQKADYILLHMNTYGGELGAADSIRTAMLNSPVPVLVFIDNQAASAGALIAIACDSIYMRSGASIGAATVVNQTGEQMPDKYQSFMRSMMRSTAEAQGKKQIIKNGDTTEMWRRNPRIAEAMVDERVVVAGVSDSGKVLTFTTSEAIANGYCEGKAENVKEVLSQAGLNDYVLKEYKPTVLEIIISFFLNPIIQALLLMAIIGGIYFELQSPGIGFPLILAITAALLYFVPLYLEGLAENWELLLFVGGLVLIGLELFVIPGFGVAGISGILLCVAGIVLAMVDNDLLHTPEGINVGILVRPVAILIIALFGGFAGGIYLTRQLYPTRAFDRIALRTDLTGSEGYVGVATDLKRLVGMTGVVYTTLRPSGQIEIDGEIYDAVAEYGMIDKGAPVVVTKYETGQLYCNKV